MNLRKRRWNLNVHSGGGDIWINRIGILIIILSVYAYAFVADVAVGVAQLCSLRYCQLQKSNVIYFGPIHLYLLKTFEFSEIVSALGTS